MNIIFFDGSERDNLLPLTFTRPVCEIRTGILRIREKWENHFPNANTSFATQKYLAEKYPLFVEEDNLLINGNTLPDADLTKALTALKKEHALFKDGKIIAARCGKNFDFEKHEFQKLKPLQYQAGISRINFPWDIFSENQKEIARDFKLITAGRKSAQLSKTNRFLQKERIFVEEGAKAEFATLNPAGGYIYIGKNAQLMEGSIVHGSLAMCESSVLKLSAKIYGASTIGPFSKVGGELNNTVITGYSNKAHDGFLGNSVIGEWCNLGADTNNSNLKNNYAQVKVWNYPKGGFLPTGLQFCGLIMGDHSKSGINTMFNTGTLVGVSANIFGSGFPRSFIPSFSWGSAGGFSTYNIKKAFKTAELVMQRRGLEFDAKEQNILRNIFDQTAEYRSR